MTQQTYGDIVRAQFKKNRAAMVGLWVIGLLFVVAIYCPVIATSSPYCIMTETGTEFPWFSDLFDQNVFPSGVDLFFNLLMVFTPLFAVPIFMRKRWSIRFMVRAGVVVAIFFLYVFFSIVGPPALLELRVGEGEDTVAVGSKVFWPQHVLRYRKPKRDYLEERQVKREILLASERIAQYAARKDTADRHLAALAAELASSALTPSRKTNAEATRTATEATRAMAERKSLEWTERRAAAVARLDDPSVPTMILPPIGYHHDDNDEERIVERPTFSGWGYGHFLGTDRNGRDVMARILYGTRISLTIGVIAVAIYCTIGTILGALMGYLGGWIDMVLMRVVEIMICFPTLPFILIIVAVFETRNIFLIMIAIGVIGWTGVARLIRGQFLVERGHEYVMAARAQGVPAHRIVFKHVLPNAIHPMFVAATFGVAQAILLESGLAFLGLGDVNVPSWGQLLLEGRQTTKLWLILSPGVAIFMTVTVLNLVGEGLRDALDPRLRE